MLIMFLSNVVDKIIFKWVDIIYYMWKARHFNGLLVLSDNKLFEL